MKLTEHDIVLLIPAKSNPKSFYGVFQEHGSTKFRVAFYYDEQGRFLWGGSYAMATDGGLVAVARSYDTVDGAQLAIRDAQVTAGQWAELLAAEGLTSWLPKKEVYPLVRIRMYKSIGLWV